MGRPHKTRFVSHTPSVAYFKPRGIPMYELEEIRLSLDECEALRLADYQGLSHEDAGRLMGVSRATFGRIIEQARKKVADALIHGKAVRIEGGSFKYLDEDCRFFCRDCSHEWAEPCRHGYPPYCPKCKGKKVGRMGRRARHRGPGGGNNDTDDVKDTQGEE